MEIIINTKQMKKEIPKKMKPRFKDNDIVWNPFANKREKYNHKRDKYRFYLTKYTNQDDTGNSRKKSN